jgi:hypothetical protein
MFESKALLLQHLLALSAFFFVEANGWHSEEKMN